MESINGRIWRSSWIMLTGTSMILKPGAVFPALLYMVGRLYAGTSTCHGRASDNPDENVGRVFSYEAGKSVTFDDDIGTEWTHIAAVRSKDRLQLYVNGELVSETSDLNANEFNLTNQLPFKIGAGEHHYFKGAIDDLRFYNTALNKEDIQAVGQEKKLR